MIDNIKFGIKINTDEFHLLPEIYENQDVIDFIEVLIPPEFTREDLTIIRDFELPYSIHFPHLKENIDFGNSKQIGYNQKFIEKVNAHKKIFDQLHPLCYIVHPESGNVEMSIENIRKLQIKPLAIENMPYKFRSGGNRLAHIPETIKPYFDNVPDIEFCFDLNHAVKTAIAESLDYIKLIKGFMKLKKPIHFHIADGDTSSEYDDHLPIGKGNYDISGLKNLLLKFDANVYLTFETPRFNKENIMDDLLNMKMFMEA
jgi:hypothetical protein